MAREGYVTRQDAFGNDVEVPVGRDGVNPATPENPPGPAVADDAQGAGTTDPVKYGVDYGDSEVQKALAGDPVGPDIAKVAEEIEAAEAAAAPTDVVPTETPVPEAAQVEVPPVVEEPVTPEPTTEALAAPDASAPEATTVDASVSGETASADTSAAQADPGTETPQA